MFRNIVFLFALLFTAFPCLAAQIKVIASIPDLADIAREIGGERITVESLASGVEDTHAVPVLPKHVSKLARADALIELGLEMEHAWLPALVDASNNPKIKPGARGDIIASNGFVPREVPTIVSRKEGEQHLQGNPHINLDPSAGRLMAKNIAIGFSEIDPAGKESYDTNLSRYLAKLDAKESEWKAAAVKLNGVTFVSYHPHWIYWADYFGMKHIGTLEPKPGIPPSGSHLNELIALMKQQNCKLVIREPQYSEKVPNEVAVKTGGTVVKLAIMVGGTPEAKTWIEMIDSNLKKMIEAVGKP